jgi:hypothetical protein
MFHGQKRRCASVHLQFRFCPWWTFRELWPIVRFKTYGHNTLDGLLVDGQTTTDVSYSNKTIDRCPDSSTEVDGDFRRTL